jgi:hypothetical protein
MAELEITLAASTGTNAFGMERFFVPEAIPVCYLTEEDSERWTFLRFQQLLAGRKLEKPPENFHLAVRRGIDIDDGEWQEKLIAAARHYGYLFMAVDPLRAFTSFADKGPSELKPVIRFFRKFMNETGCTPRIVHHDNKPIVGRQDDRDLPQRASGGGIYSIADCPFSFRKVNKTQTLVTPVGFKFIEDPRPFKFTLTTQEEGNQFKSIRLIGQEVGIEADARNLEVLERLLDSVKKEPGKPMTFYAKGRNKQDGLEALKELNRQGQIHFVKGGGRAVLCHPGPVDIFDVADPRFNPEVEAVERVTAVDGTR